jgi:sugar O-acyltransferase (sialic acid O-acetyltransferase NeuD family)
MIAPSGPCVVFGAGGHARVVIGILQEERSTLRPALAVDIDASRKAVGAGESILGVPVHAIEQSLDAYLQRGLATAVLAIGHNGKRAEWYERLKSAGFALPNVVSSYAVLHPSATLGSANVFCPHAYVGPLVNVGDNNLLNTRSTLEHEVRIGSSNHIAPHAVLLGRVKLGDRNFIGAHGTVRDNVTLQSDITVGAGGAVIASLSTPGVYVGVPTRRLEKEVA